MNRRIKNKKLQEKLMTTEEDDREWHDSCR